MKVFFDVETIIYSFPPDTKENKKDELVIKKYLHMEKILRGNFIKGYLVLQLKRFFWIKCFQIPEHIRITWRFTGIHYPNYPTFYSDTLIFTLYSNIK